MSLIRQAVYLAMVWVLLCCVSSATCSDTIPIASIFSFSGTAARTNRPSILSTRWAIEEINASGGIDGRQLALLEFDNASTPIGSKVAAEKAVAAGAVAIIGPAYSSHCIAAARVAQHHGTPLITNVATDPDVTRVGDFIFRVCFSDTFQSRLLARFARQELGLSTAVIVVNANSTYSLGLAREFRIHFDRLGGSLAADLYYKNREASFDEQVNLVKAANPSLVFIPGYLESALIARKLAEAGVTATLLGADGWDLEAFKEMGGETIRLGYYTTHWVKENQVGRSREFVSRYDAIQPLNASSALAYDAVMLLADALRRAKSTERGDIRQALAETTHFEGITGKIALDVNGDPIKPAVIMKITNGEYSYLKQVNP